MSNKPLALSIKRENLFFYLLLAVVISYVFIFIVDNHLRLFWQMQEYITRSMPRSIVGDGRYYFVQSIRMESFKELIQLAKVNKNLFFPISYGKVLQNSPYLIFFVNLIFFTYSVKAFVKHVPNRKIILSMIMLHPVIVGALFGISKEVFAYSSILLMMSYSVDFKKRNMFISLLLALFARIEMAILMVVYVATFKFQKKYRALIVLWIIFGISTVIVIKNYTQMTWLEVNAREGSWGLVKALSVLAVNGGYIIVYPARVILNFFAEVFVPPVINPNYRLFIYISNWIYLLLTLVIVVKKRFTLRNNFFYLFVIYTVFMSVPAFVSHRYVVPVFPLIVYLALFNDDHLIVENKVSLRPLLNSGIFLCNNRSNWRSLWPRKSIHPS